MTSIAQERSAAPTSDLISTVAQLSSNISKRFFMNDTSEEIYLRARGRSVEDVLDSFLLDTRETQAIPSGVWETPHPGEIATIRTFGRHKEEIEVEIVTPNLINTTLSWVNPVFVEYTNTQEGPTQGWEKLVKAYSQFRLERYDAYHDTLLLIDLTLHPESYYLAGFTGMQHDPERSLFTDDYFLFSGEKVAKENVDQLKKGDNFIPTVLTRLDWLRAWTSAQSRHKAH